MNRSVQYQALQFSCDAKSSKRSIGEMRFPAEMGTASPKSDESSRTCFSCSHTGILLNSGMFEFTTPLRRAVDTRRPLRKLDVHPSRVTLLPAQILHNAAQVVVKPIGQFMADGTNFVCGCNRCIRHRRRPPQVLWVCKSHAVQNRCRGSGFTAVSGADRIPRANPPKTNQSCRLPTAPAPANPD